MSALSPELMYFASRMSGFSTNTFKIETNNQSSATSSSIISIDLPNNSIINLRSFKLFFSAITTGAGAGGRLPPVKDLIERVEVAMGGIVLSQGTNFTNVLSEAKKALHADYTDAVLGHPEYIRATSYVNPADTYTGTADEADANTLYCVDEFEGFLSTADPMLFDTSIVPSIRIRFYMASDNVLSNVPAVTLGTASGSFADSAGSVSLNGAPLPLAPNATKPKYSLSNIHATIECISLADMTYENMLSSQMSAQGDLEVPYKAYYTFLDTHQGTSKFSVSASSLDRIWLAWRGADYNTVNNPITVAGHKVQGGFVHRSTALVNGALSGSTALVIDSLVGDAPEVGDIVVGAGLTSGVTIVAVVSATAYTLSSPQSISDNILLTFERDAGVPQYDLGSLLGTGEEKYKGRYFNFSQPVAYGATTDWKCQCQLNGSYMPQFSARVEELYGITRNSLEGNRKPRMMTLDQYRKNFCVQVFRLNMPNSEFSRNLTGVDSRATNLQGIVRTENAVNGSNLSIFCETTEILNISSGRSISVVV
jgi:hypothetical protein